MLLTHGNIRKSRVLKHIFLDLPDEGRIFPDGEHCGDYAIFRGLHDARLKISEIGPDIAMDLWSLPPPEERRRILFRNASIISRNVVRRNGHISRMNRLAVPVEYGYEELYSHCGQKFITLALFYRVVRKRRGFWRTMLLTMKYGSICIEK